MSPTSTHQVRAPKVCSCGKPVVAHGKCAECNAKRGILQRRAAGPIPVVSVPGTVERVLNSPGRPLDPSTRSWAEAGFGADFSRVRVHADETAARSAQAVRAHAYTVGSSIVFDNGRYSPSSIAGRELLAHELAHVVQQSLDGDGFSEIGAELEAQQAATRLSGGGNASIRTAARGLQRDANTRTRDVRQLSCVIRLGGCTSGVIAKDGGTATEDIPKLNEECRKENPGAIDVHPTPAECRNPPREALTPAGEALLAALYVAGAGAAIGLAVAGAEAVVIPVAIAAAEFVGAQATAAFAFYAGNAFVINAIGPAIVGMLISCEGNPLALLDAAAKDPALAAQLFIEGVVLHAEARTASGPSKPASTKVVLLPREQQTTKNRVQFKAIGPLHYDGLAANDNATPTPRPPTPQAANDNHAPGNVVPIRPPVVQRPPQAAEVPQAATGTDGPNRSRPPVASSGSSGKPSATVQPSAPTRSGATSSGSRDAKSGAARGGSPSPTPATPQTEQERLLARIDAMRALRDQHFADIEQARQSLKRPLSPAERTAILEEQADLGRKAQNLIEAHNELLKQHAALEKGAYGLARAYSYSATAAKEVTARATRRDAATGKTFLADEYSGKPVDEISIDHVVPVSRIADMEGFRDLSDDDRNAILSRTDNLKVMEKALNSSKGPRRWRDWSAGQRFYKAVWHSMVELEGQLEASIQKEILERKARRIK